MAKKVYSISSCILFGCIKVNGIGDVVRTSHDTSDAISEDASVLWPVIGFHKPIEDQYVHADSAMSRSDSFRQHRISWLPPLKFQRQSAHEPSLPQFSTPTRPLLSRSRTMTTNSSSEYSRNTYSSSVSRLSRHPSTMSSFSSLSCTPTSECAPWSTMRMATKPAVPTIPEKYDYKDHKHNNRMRPTRPGSRPAMPPADFWKYASKQQIRSTSSGYPHPTIAAYETTSREPSVCRYPILMAPKRPVLKTSAATVSSEIAQIRDKSYESLRKGGSTKDTSRRSSTVQTRNSKALDSQRGIDQYKMRRTLEGQTPERRCSRTLVKKRQPFDSERRRRSKIV